MRWHYSSRHTPLFDRLELPGDGSASELGMKPRRFSDRARIRLIATRNADVCPMRPEGSTRELDHRRLLRRTSISSIPTGIQRLYAISKVTRERSCSSRASPEK